MGSNFISLLEGKTQLSYNSKIKLYDGCNKFDLLLPISRYVLSNLNDS